MFYALSVAMTVVQSRFTGLCHQRLLVYAQFPLQSLLHGTMEANSACLNPPVTINTLNQNHFPHVVILDSDNATDSIVSLHDHCHP